MIPIRDENPTIHPPILTVTFIVINVLVYWWQVSPKDEVVETIRVFRYAAVPLNLSQSDDEAVLVTSRPVTRGPALDLANEIGFSSVPRGEEVPPPAFLLARQAVSPWLTVLTSMFMHGSLMHLLGNMLFLWVFGNNIEDALGRSKFLVFYLLSGAAATAAHVASDPASVVPTIGASGAVSGVLGGYLLLYPRARVLTLLPLGFFMYTMHVPALVFLPLWIAREFLSVLGGGAGNVAHWAHIGGFVVGLVLVKFMETVEHRSRATGRGRARSIERWT